MQYTEFRFENFKGIGSMTLPLDGDVTTLIGLNESGKTTILEAIFCFSYGAENLDALDPTMASMREPERWIPISLRSNFNDTIRISASVKLSDSDRRALKTHMRREFGLTLAETPSDIDITEHYHFENSRYVQNPGVKNKTWTLNISGTTGRQQNPRTYKAKTDEWQGAVAFLRDRLPSIWYFPNFLFELPERFMLEGQAADGATSEEQDKDQFYKSTFEEILRGLGIGASLDTHIVERARSDDRTDQRNLRSLLLDMSREISRVVFEGWNRIFGHQTTPQEVLLEADVETNGDVFLELKIKGPDGYYDLSERSLGFRWFFMFLLMTSYRGAASEDGQEKSVVFLLDEPASNLHSSAQAELLKSFETLAQSCHLIYTTHSHHMINIRWLESAYVVKNEALGDLDLENYFTAHTAKSTDISATRYRQFVSENPGSTSYFQPVLDLLEYRPSDLEPVPSVVLVEGKTDFYLLRYFTEILDLPSTLKFVPGGGAGSLDPLIRLHIGWGKSFIILLDGDREGRLQKTRYEREFGPLVADRCEVLPDLLGDSNVKEVENLLSQADRETVITSVFIGAAPRPARKKALHQALVELYARREPVVLDKATVTRLADLVAVLEQGIADQD